MQTITTNRPLLPLMTAQGTYYLCPDEIIRLKASSNYTTIYFEGNKKLVSAKVLKDFDQLLAPFGFLRTHRTHLVNRQHISRVIPGGHIIMRDASVAEISRRQRSRIIKTLNNAA